MGGIRVPKLGTFALKELKFTQRRRFWSKLNFAVMCLKTEACSLAAIRVASKKSKIALMSRWGVVSPLDTLLCSSHVLKFSTILRNGPLMPVTGVLLESRDQITSKCVICCNKNCIDYSYTFQTTTATTSSSSLTALSSQCLKITKKISFL